MCLSIVHWLCKVWAAVRQGAQTIPLPVVLVLWQQCPAISSAKG